MPASKLFDVLITRVDDVVVIKAEVAGTATVF